MKTIIVSLVAAALSVNVWSTRKIEGNTVELVGEYFHTKTIKGVYSIEENSQEITFRTKDKKVITYAKGNMISYEIKE